jgi:hypothetical protein
MAVFRVKTGDFGQIGGQNSLFLIKTGILFVFKKPACTVFPAPKQQKQPGLLLKKYGLPGPALENPQGSGF